MREAVVRCKGFVLISGVETVLPLVSLMRLLEVFIHPSVQF